MGCCLLSKFTLGFVTLSLVYKDATRNSGLDFWGGAFKGVDVSFVKSSARSVPYELKID